MGPVLSEAGLAMTVQITRLDFDVDGLRKQAARVAEASVARRVLALALVLEGQSRAAAAKCSATALMAARIASFRNAPERVGHCLTRMLP